MTNIKPEPEDDTSKDSVKEWLFRISNGEADRPLFSPLYGEHVASLVLQPTDPEFIIKEVGVFDKAGRLVYATQEPGLDHPVMKYLATITRARKHFNRRKKQRRQRCGLRR